MTITAIEATINAQLADLESALDMNILRGDDDRIKGCEFAIIELNILLETFKKQAKQKEEDNNTLKNEAFLSA